MARTYSTSQPAKGGREHAASQFQSATFWENYWLLCGQVLWVHQVSSAGKGCIDPEKRTRKDWGKCWFSGDVHSRAQHAGRLESFSTTGSRAPTEQSSIDRTLLRNNHSIIRGEGLGFHSVQRDEATVRQGHLCTLEPGRSVRSWGGGDV